MTRTINRAAMTIKTIMQTSTVSEKFDREDDDQGTHEIEDQTNEEMKKMSCDAKWYICNCGSDFSSYDRLSYCLSCEQWKFWSLLSTISTTE